MISAVIPAYNAAAFIRRTIDSILTQSLQPEEIIVVDDGSTDDTKSVVDAYGGKVRCIRQDNAGDGPARNTGVAAAKGEWIAFLDHDDEWLPHKLERQMTLLDRHSDLCWCGTNFYRACGQRRTAAGNTRTLRTVMGTREYFEDFFDAVAVKGCTLVTTTMLVHRSVFDDVGIFETGWPLAADFDMWWRIAYRHPRLGYIPEPLALMNLGDLDPTGIRRHLRGKRGDEARRLVRKHLELSRQERAEERFYPMARKVLHESLAATLYHGFKSDARETVRDFPQFFRRYERWGAYVLTTCPPLTVGAARAAAYLAHTLGIERHVTRRWIRGGSPSDAE